MPDILVTIRKFGEDNQSAVIREVMPVRVNVLTNSLLLLHNDCHKRLWYKFRVYLIQVAPKKTFICLFIF